MNLNDLTLELREKALASKTPEEAFAVVKDSGIELSEDELDKIAGGNSMQWDDKGKICPSCGSKDTYSKERFNDENDPNGVVMGRFTCNSCGNAFVKSIYFED